MHILQSLTTELCSDGESNLVEKASDNFAFDFDINPNRKCHDWRNHVPAVIEKLWIDLSETERLLVIVAASLAASKEEWE